VAGAALLACVGASWLSADAQLLTAPSPPYQAFAAQLRVLVPPGEPVASSMREWFAFAGRNPSYTYEFRSVPPFNTSVLAMIAEQRPRYLALHLAETPGGAPADDSSRQRYYFIYPPWTSLYDYLDRSTELVGVVSNPMFGTVEVRRVKEWPAL